MVLFSGLAPLFDMLLFIFEILQLVFILMFCFCFESDVVLAEVSNCAWWEVW